MTLAVGNDWVAVGPGPIPLDQLASWAVRPGCGAVVLFAGTVRDHAQDRPGVVCLEYEAYEEAAARQLGTISARMRDKWPGLGAVALLHRTGLLGLTEVSVAVAVSAPHRPEAFEAARWGIDTVKAEVPIWKKETWQGGSSWGLDAHPLGQDAHEREAPEPRTPEHSHAAPVPGSSSTCA